MPTRRTINDDFSEFRGRAQTLRAYKRLVRYVLAGGFKEGDRLPPQQLLKNKLGLNNCTLGAAMQRLVAGGFLTRKPRVGTLIANLKQIPAVPWTVGVASPPLSLKPPSSFFGNLTIYLQSTLVARGCHCIAYYQMARGFNPPLTDFPGLADDVKHGDIDGLVLLTGLGLAPWRSAVKRDIPLCHTAVWEEAPCGVLIDTASMIAAALRMFAEQGLRRIALIDTGENHGRRAQAIADVLKDRAISHVLGGGPTTLLSFPSVADGQATARQLLALPAPQRPDALIVTDDHVCLGLTSVLREEGDYRPSIAVQSNLQVPLIFPLPVTEFQVDLTKIADKTVTLLLERLIHPRGPERVEWVAPERMA